MAWCNPYQSTCPGMVAWDRDFNPYAPTPVAPSPLHEPLAIGAEQIDPLSLVSPALRPLDDELDVLLPYEPPVAVPALYTTWAPLPSPLAVREASAVSEPYLLVLLLVGLALVGWRRR